MEAIGRDPGGIAHDFNNALFAIKGYAELLAEDLAPERRAHLAPDEALRSVQAIIDAAARATSLTAELLTWSPRLVVGPERPEDPPATVPEPLPVERTGTSWRRDGGRG